MFKPYYSLGTLLSIIIFLVISLISFVFINYYSSTSNAFIAVLVLGLLCLLILGIMFIEWRLEYKNQGLAIENNKITIYKGGFTKQIIVIYKKHIIGIDSETTHYRMKKGILLSSLALLFTILVTGCSCSKDGTYAFAHIEYAENGENVTSDCSSPEGEHEIQFCTAVKTFKFNEISFVLEDKKITINAAGQESLTADYKIEDGEILLRDSEEDEYVNIFSSFNMKLLYEDKTIKIHSDFYTVVFAK
jgi:membrane protein YdbS with pleckstrin-like domain